MVLLLQAKEDETMTTSETILSIRKATGLSQTAFGRRFGIPRRTIQDWEAGRMSCPAYVAELLAFAAQTDYRTPRLTEEEEERKMKRTTYKGYIIDTDDLGRPYIYNTDSPYGEDSDHILVQADTVMDAKRIIDARIETGQDVRSTWGLI
jgi:transcriptional regulator with XRE-family HTH domain